MGRLRADFIQRIDDVAIRVLEVADLLEQQRCSRRIVDQITGSGTSVGANVGEADEALSRKDFCKCIGTSLKELSETRYWLRISGRRGWFNGAEADLLYAESAELKRILGAILTRSRTSGT